MSLFETSEDPVQELHQNVARPFERATAMPKSVYTSELFLDKEIRNIFAREWFCVGRTDGLPNPGDYLALELAGQPIMVVRDHKGKLRAQANVCRHRMSVLLEGRGNRRTIVCPYHGWTYGLDGRLRGAPAMTHNKGFDRSLYRLPQIRCEEWLGWILVSLNSEIERATQRFSAIETMVEDYDMVSYKQAFFETWEWNTNWKVLAENFMESYHLPVCHAATIGGLSKVDDVTCPAGHERFNYHTLQKEESFTLSIAHSNNRRMQGERRLTTYLLSIYPSLMITLTPGYFWYLSLYPLATGRVRIYYGGGFSRDFAEDSDSEHHVAELRQLLDEVNAEDRKCTERVYSGLSSDFATPGHLSHLERPNFEFARYLSRRIDQPE